MKSNALERRQLAWIERVSTRIIVEIPPPVPTLDIDSRFDVRRGKQVLLFKGTLPILEHLKSGPSRWHGFMPVAEHLYRVVSSKTCNLISAKRQQLKREQLVVIVDGWWFRHESHLKLVEEAMR